MAGLWFGSLSKIAKVGNFLILSPQLQITIE